MLPEFDLLMPKTLPEALEMLAEGAPDVVPLAGGTGLLVDMRGGLRHPGLLVNVAGLDELHGVRREDGHVVVGGGVTIAELLDDPLIARHASALRDGAAVFANPLVRNRATVGGNLVYASPAADTAPPLLVLEAEVELVSKEGSRRVPLEDFITGVRETVRRPDELLAAVRWPLPAPHSASAFHKLALRKADAISVLSVAVMVEGDGGGGGVHCQQARIALGAVAPRPIRARAAEEVLRGQPLTPDVIAGAARLSAECAAPIDDIRGSAAYRRRVVEVLVRRLLTEVARNQVFS
jgi:CO/xanthine dehydrogenase FAD-binding subunit